MPLGSRSTMRPRARRRPDRYGALLVFILIDCTVIFTTDNEGIGRWLPVVLVSLTVLVGLETSEVTGRWVNPARATAVLVVVLAVVEAFVENDELLAWLGIVQAALLGVLVAAIFSRLIRHEHVRVQTLLGVICAYVLFGLIFAFLAFGLSGVHDRQFWVQDADERLANFVYYSFVTLTTVGFGDLTPATDVGKAMASFEALLGQIYLVTVVARLVSLYSRDTAPPATGDGAEGAQGLAPE